MKQLTLDIGPAGEPGFSSYVEEGNEAAVQGLHELLQQLLDAGGQGGGPSVAPVYLWGPRGAGKSHLLKATAAAARECGLRCAWFEPAQPGHWTLEHEPDLLLLDDAQDWNPEQQQAAFSAFVRTTALGGGVLAAGRLPPVDLPLRDDIRSRLGWGHVLGLQPAGESVVRRVLQACALSRGLRLGDEVLDYVLRRHDRDLKSLIELLDRLDRYALQRQRPLTVPLLRDMLDEEPR